MFDRFLHTQLVERLAQVFVILFLEILFKDRSDSKISYKTECMYEDLEPIAKCTQRPTTLRRNRAIKQLVSCSYSSKVLRENKFSVSSADFGTPLFIKYRTT